jgi:ankyrin repeat protein
MKRMLLFFILFTSTLVMAMEDRRPFKDFVSRYRDRKLSERVNEYRNKVLSLIMQGLWIYGRSKGDFVYKADGYLVDLILEIAKQGDFESLELLEKDLKGDIRYEFWNAVERNDDMDGAKKLLVKWAKENPTVLMLRQYQPNGLNLLIEMAEDKNAKFEDRHECLLILSRMPDAAKVLDRIRALTSDKSHSLILNVPEFPKYEPTVGRAASYAVDEIERRRPQEKGKLENIGFRQDNPIHDAARAGDLAKVKALLKDNPGLISNRDSRDGCTPLLPAAAYDRKDVVEFLLAKNAEIDAKDKGVGWTPLQAASANGHKDMVELLIANGANFAVKDNYGKTPLHDAAFNGRKDVAELLLAKGAEINARSNVGSTPLHWAAMFGRKDVVGLLLGHGAEVNAKDNDGKTPMKLAAENGKTDVIELLRQHGGHE